MFKPIQHEVDDWAQTLRKPYWEPLSNLARLIEEVGELGRLFNHLYGDKPKKESEAQQEVGGELMDIMFTCICIANSQGIDLDEEFKKTMKKCRDRDKDRFQKKAA